MPLVKKNEQFPERPIVVLLVGTPFSRKTSLANTTKNPILIDADRGSDRSHGRPDTFVIKEGWGELEQEDTNGLFNGYNTAILDTAKAILDDFLTEFVISKNYKLRTNKMQMYGAIGDEFKLFVNKRRSQNMDIVVISHDKTKDDDGIATINPDITGGSKNLILRIADQVGFVSNKSMKNEKGEIVNVVTVNFNPSETAPFCKNVANLPELILPDKADPKWKLFMDREIMQPTKDAISKMTDEQKIALEFIESWQVAIDAIVVEGGNADITSKELMETYNGKAGITTISEDHLKKQVAAYFKAHLKKIGFKWVDADKAFKPVVSEDTPPPVDNKTTEEKAQETPPNVVKEEKPAVYSESNPNALVKKPKEDQKLHIGETEGVPDYQEDDLFAPTGD